jgi:hypothetical protein
LTKEVSGEPLDLHPFRGRIDRHYNHPLFREAISDCRLLESPEAKVVLHSRNKVGVVSLPTANGGRSNIFVKEYRQEGVDKLKSLFIPSKARRAWLGAVGLVERGIPTPLPVAYLERRKKGFVAEICFLSEEVSDALEIRGLFRKLPEDELRGLLVALAGFLSSCHRKGILHRDLSDGNILVRKENGGIWKFWLLDTNRIRIKRRIGLGKSVKNLVRLGIPPHLQEYFLKSYLNGQRPGRVLSVWYRINKAGFAWSISFKKKLGLRKLARKLKIQ